MDNTTPTEIKAKELIEKFIPFTMLWNEQKGFLEDLDHAKQCALICVDEIKKLPYHLWFSEKQANEFCAYWQSVRTAIEKH